MGVLPIQMWGDTAPPNRKGLPDSPCEAQIASSHPVDFLYYRISRWESLLTPVGSPVCPFLYHLTLSFNPDCPTGLGWVDHRAWSCNSLLLHSCPAIPYPSNGQPVNPCLWLVVTTNGSWRCARSLGFCRNGVKREGTCLS